MQPSPPKALTNYSWSLDLNRAKDVVRYTIVQVQEMVAGRVDFYVSPTLGIVPQYQSKQLKILATTSPQRLPNLPEVPTVREKGIDFVRFGWLGICAAAGTPAPIIDLLHKHIAAIVASPDYRDVTERAGSIPAASSPEELRKIILQTRADVEATIQEFGLQVEQ